MDYPTAQETPIRSFLVNLLKTRLSGESFQWLRQKLTSLDSEFNTRTLYLTFATIPRHLEDVSLQLTAEEQSQAETLREAWQLSHWTTVQAARVVSALYIPGSGAEFVKILETLFSTAEVNEQVALYQGLSIFPYSDLLSARAAEGVRTNMTVVFDAIALDNPYPKDYLSEDAWNQMVLKSLFMDRPLYRIQGIDHRGNSALTLMISDYAHERWAAGRNTSPEMWRPIKDFSVIASRGDLDKLMQSKDPMQRAAALLSQTPLGSELDESKIDQLSLVEHRNILNWDDLGMHYQNLQELSAN